MIQFFNVTKKYENGNIALKDVSVAIKKGEFVFLVGASGAGKSTFTHMLIREIVPSQGQILVDGQSIIRMKNRHVPFLRRKVGFIFQDYQLLQDRTVFENIAFALEIVGLSPQDIKKKVTMVIELVGLAGHEKSYPEQLSGGEQQRVAIARAIVNNPPLIVADEPTGNLDPETSLEIMKIFNSINKWGTTILMATHDKEMVNRMRKRVIQLSFGEIIRDEEKGGYYNAQ